MAGDVSLSRHGSNDPSDHPGAQGIRASQETIYLFLLHIVRQRSPELVLSEFQSLFFNGESSTNPAATQALYTIIFDNNEAEFRNTFKRSCYILVNNWYSVRKHQAIADLVQWLGEIKFQKDNISPSLNRLRGWIKNFVSSEDYHSLVATFHGVSGIAKQHAHWSDRYTSYLLVEQYTNSNNPIEQRKIARDLARQLQEKFKFDLAMYTARCETSTSTTRDVLNPTRLGDGVIRLIKTVVSRNILFNYVNQSRLFAQQSKNLNYLDFKQSLLRYLIASNNQQLLPEVIQTKLAEKLDVLYQKYDGDLLNAGLFLRTCNRLIEHLTTEQDHQPSELFQVFAIQGKFLTLAILLVKLLLICRYTRSHLESRLAHLIQYHWNLPEENCRDFIYFLEVFNVILVIYADNVEYNLLNIESDCDRTQPFYVELDTYRVFSQLRGADLRGIQLQGADLRHANLRGADLRGADLSCANLSWANLNLARLNGAILSGARMQGISLVTADLSQADLNSANLNGADLRHATLHHANLSHANLKAAKLRGATLVGATLSYATLTDATLVQVDLSQAELVHVDCHQADFSQATLEAANLSHADLSSANLYQAQAQQAQLIGAQLSQANLCQVNLMNANLNGANLYRTVLNDANLKQATLTQVFARGICLDGACLSGANLSRSDLSHAECRRADLSRVDLSHALLRYVDLEGATLSQAILNDTNVNGTEFTQVCVDAAQFNHVAGLSPETQLMLQQRGAIATRK